MAVRIYKPTSPGRRHSSVSGFEGLTKKQPEKSLIEIIKRRAGRNNQGKITVRHRGGGAKRYYRIVDFKRKKFDVLATVTAIEYDPNRSARIALLEYADGEKIYILSPKDLAIGEVLVSSMDKVEIKSGNRTALGNIPAGVIVHNIEMTPGRGGQLVRSAGMGAQIMATDGDYVQIKLPSGEVRKFLKVCTATIGEVGNADHRNIRWGKAGRMRHKGRRPSVRGKAMNPVDHPHGGGEGSHPIGLTNPKTPQGRPALGKKTRKRKKASNQLIVKRRNKK